MHTGEHVKIRCPVCRGTLCDHLLSEQSVIEQSDRDDLRTTSDVKIVPTVFHF
jgi:hypothetical protein